MAADSDDAATRTLTIVGAVDVPAKERDDEGGERGWDGSDERGWFDRAKQPVAERQVDVNLLRKNLSQFMEGIQQMLDVQPDEKGPFRLKSVEISAEISVNGDFKLLGTGVGAEAKSTVTFVLERP